ncbi:MAG: T9SS type A sorting domain-containing protein [Chitinophagaceae bacterium]|nr:T9SS type A sorting domain-containing protein [Chitinophagaceae bacterium]MCW5906090.1 T9SS type A sorting domain-containing protein [Chitinophagaceae bacterium]
MLTKKLLLTVSLFFLLTWNVFAIKWQTPGTGVNYTLDDLVTNSSGSVTFLNSEYFINDTIEIKKFDTLTLTNNDIVRFAPNTYLWINGGTILVNPSTNILLTAQDNNAGFLGVRLDSSDNAYFKNMTFEYAVSFRLVDCSPTFENCTFQYNNVGTSTSFGNGAIALFRSNPFFNNCQFLNNRRAAIQGGANINNAPKIYNSIFSGNDTYNQNVPQINLGATSTAGEDTVKIINNQILNAGGIQGGGIGFLPVGNVYAVITGNTIRNNRYGITFNGANNINAMVSYNVIDSNNIQNNPALGGSGISFTGGSAGSIGQNTIVTGNIIRANLWGITIQQRSRPHIGNINNADTSDNGKNHFINNTNTTTPGIDLYNNSPDDVDAQNNYWNTDELSAVEGKIFHNPDNGSLGVVNYQPFLTSINMPVTLKNFNATLKGNEVLLTWQTTTEENTAHFNIQKSLNGTEFYTIGTLKAKGNSNQLVNYSYTDKINTESNKHFYKLAIVDKDGTTTYSNIRLINISKKVAINFYPNPAKDYVVVESKNARNIQVLDLRGRVLINMPVQNDHNILHIQSLTSGNYILKVTNSKGEETSEKLVVK